jgi:two-component system response regulator FixJ
VTENPIIHVVDDDPFVRDGICQIFEDEGYSVKTYASALEFLETIGPRDHGWVVSDLSLPEMSGIALLTHISQRNLPFSVVVVTGYADVSLAVQAMKKGAVDFIEKPFHADELIASVRLALARQNGIWDDASNLHEILSRLATLSAREHEVLARVLNGRPNTVIAHELGISATTVETYCANLMKKMQAANISKLVSMSLMAERHRESAP